LAEHGLTGSAVVDMAPTDLDLATTDPRLDAFALMRRGFARAIDDGHVAHECWFSIAGQTVRLRFAGDALVAPLTRAIAHLATSPVATPALDVELWDSTSTHVELSSIMEFVVETARRAPFGALTPRYEVRGLHSDRVHTTFELGSGVLTMFDVRERRAVYWVRDPSDLPFYERGAPLRTLLNWWLSQRGLHCVHAGAVGSDRGAVLLTGKGGSGKSTTTLACLDSDLRYAADDYCAISLGDAPAVHSLYNTGKLNDTVDLDRQPRFSPWVVNREQLGKEKLLMFLHEHVPDRILTAAPLRAIVLPQVTDRQTASLEPVAPAEALRALAPTTMFQLPGAAGQAMLTMAGLVRQLPCYRLLLGRDVSTGPARLTELLERTTRGLGDGHETAPTVVAAP
jgi:hypothetical protein